MKKIIGLIVPVGLIVILIPFVYHTAKAAISNSGSLSGPVLAGPDWFDPAWNYRRPVTISNPEASLEWDQVLIKLTAGNFNFSRANNDGSDVRFTFSDGTTELSYWIESWDSAAHLANIWVRMPNIGPGNNTIYMYYDNPAASPKSNGNATFERFEDDWSQFAGQVLSQAVPSPKSGADGTTSGPFSWVVITGTPAASDGILSLADGEGIKSTSTSLYTAMGMRAKISSGNGNEWGGFINGATGSRTLIGDLPADTDDLYLTNSQTSTENILIPRVGGADWHNNYHIYEVRWAPGLSKADIDHGAASAASNQPTNVPNTSLPVTLYSYAGSNATLTVDWVYVRVYRDPEPTFSIGSEQGLVALSIAGVDSPDPVRKLYNLTYQLTISNTSQINAPGVVVTDTLPASVQLGQVSSSQGSCEPGSIVLCDLGTISAGSAAWITINVVPTVDGVITNLAEVGSPFFELDLSDNTSTQETLVDTVSPVVNWEKPVHNGGNYSAIGGSVLLEASATDNDQVARVEFNLWDHNANKYVNIGIDYSYPYQAQFDPNIMVANQIYQLYAYAYDRAGNQTRQVIYIQRAIGGFLPIVRR